MVFQDSLQRLTESEGMTEEEVVDSTGVRADSLPAAEAVEQNSPPTDRTTIEAIPL